MVFLDVRLLHDFISNFSDTLFIGCLFDDQFESNLCQFNGSIIDDPELVNHLRVHNALNVPQVVSNLDELENELMSKNYSKNFSKWSLLH
jgi:hypothetical protein